MRFLIFGAGAIGTYIGGSLALAGQDVVFLERAEVAEELSRRGLSLQHVIKNPRIGIVGARGR
jgi:2-dehydropantoate 2-reductase